jgi:hypothetical protein
MAQLLVTIDLTAKNLGPGVLPPGSGSLSSVLEQEKVMPIVATMSKRKVSFFMVIGLKKFLERVIKYVYILSYRFLFMGCWCDIFNCHRPFTRSWKTYAFVIPSDPRILPKIIQRPAIISHLLIPGNAGCRKFSFIKN